MYKLNRKIAKQIGRNLHSLRIGKYPDDSGEYALRFDDEFNNVLVIGSEKELRELYKDLWLILDRGIHNYRKPLAGFQKTFYQRNLKRDVVHTTPLSAEASVNFRTQILEDGRHHYVLYVNNKLILATPMEAYPRGGMTIGVIESIIKRI